MSLPRALVTGAAAGIGRATAERLAFAGYHVYALDRDSTLVGDLVSKINADGRSASAVIVDLSDEEAIVASLAALEPCDVLVNNAGVFSVRSVFELSAEDFRFAYDINTVAPFLLIRELARRMPEGARIVNVSSRAAFGGGKYAHYAASKAGVIGLTKALAIELAPQGITVNAVAPGAIDTQMARGRPDMDVSALLAVQLVKRLGSTDEIASAIEFLASPNARYITGHVLVVDGGRSLCGPHGL